MLKLSHILSPAVRSDNSALCPELEEDLPRAVIGALPAAAGLHLAIAHQLGERLGSRPSMDVEYGLDDLTVSEPPAMAVQKKVADRSTLIIASTRSRWHETLLEENDVWIRDFGGNPEVSDALRRVDIRYCQQPKDAQILCALLHAAGDGEVGAASGLGNMPGLIVAWDLFGLFVGEEGVASGKEGTKDSAEGSAAIRSAQLTIPFDAHLLAISPAPAWVILEPQVTSVTEIPISTSVIPPTSRVIEGKNQRHLKLVRGLEWILAPGYAEDKSRRTLVEITKVTEKDDAMDDEPPPAAESPSDSQRFIISSAGNVIASFERRDEAYAPGKPWLDRAGSWYEWIPAEEPLEGEEA